MEHNKRTVCWESFIQVVHDIYRKNKGASATVGGGGIKKIKIVKKEQETKRR